MARYIRFCLALDLALVALQHMFPFFQGVLPLGGSHFSQLAILLFLGVAASEFDDTGEC